MYYIEIIKPFDFFVKCLGFFVSSGGAQPAFLHRVCASAPFAFLCLKFGTNYCKMIVEISPNSIVWTLAGIYEKI
jgi:hypothetical protein